jgi:hypothetical protein
MRVLPAPVGSTTSAFLSSTSEQMRRWYERKGFLAPVAILDL